MQRIVARTQQNVKLCHTTNMYGIDSLLAAAVAAAFFWNCVSVLLQRKWRFYDVFVSKKYGILVHIALVSLALLQVLLTTTFDYRSDWGFKTFWPFSVPVLLVAIWLFITSVRELGVGALYNKNFFGKRVHIASALQIHFRLSLHISYVVFFI